MSRPVKCVDCATFRPASVNPEAAAGNCASGAHAESTSAVRGGRLGMICWPYAPRYCEAHTGHKAYERNRAAWIASNANASPQEYEQAMRENAQRAGV